MEKGEKGKVKKGKGVEEREFKRREEKGEKVRKKKKVEKSGELSRC